MQKLEDDMQQLGEKIKHHEDNVNYLKTLRNKLEDSIVDMQGMQLCMYILCVLFFPMFSFLTNINVVPKIMKYVCQITCDFLLSTN